MYIYLNMSTKQQRKTIKNRRNNKNDRNGYNDTKQQCVAMEFSMWFGFVIYQLYFLFLFGIIFYTCILHISHLLLVLSYMFTSVHLQVDSWIYCVCKKKLRARKTCWRVFFFAFLDFVCFFFYYFYRFLHWICLFFVAATIGLVVGNFSFSGLSSLSLMFRFKIIRYE